MNEQMRALITGASSGIGLALAKDLSQRGYEVALLARRGELLEKLARELKTRAAFVACDVTDVVAVGRAVRTLERQLGPFDLAIANAGIRIAGHATNFNVRDAEQTIRVNLLGMLYLFGAVIPGMVERRHGRFVGIASMAGLRGTPLGATYSASKSAMQVFLEASRIELAPYGIGVTIVNPGFIATPLTVTNNFEMPLLMRTDRAAKIIVNGIERGTRVVEFPWRMSLLMHTIRHLPDPLYDRLAARYVRWRNGEI